MPGNAGVTGRDQGPKMPSCCSKPIVTWAWLMHSHLAGPLVHEGTCTTTPKSHGWAAAGGLLREIETLALGHRALQGRTRGNLEMM